MKWSEMKETATGIFNAEYEDETARVSDLKALFDGDIDEAADYDKLYGSLKELRKLNNDLLKRIPANSNNEEEEEPSDITVEDILRGEIG